MQQHIFKHMDEVTKLVVVIIERRLELGWSQEELAERAGVQRSAVGRLETLGAVPQVDTLQKIAQALHLKFVSREGEQLFEEVEIEMLEEQGNPCKNFVDLIRGRVQTAAAPAEGEFEVTMLTEAAWQSAALGGQVVKMGVKP